MESVNKEPKQEKPTWEANFDNELQRLSEEVRPRILNPEFVRPLKVSEVLPVLGVAESVLERKENGLDFTAIFVGPDTARTQDAVMQGKSVESVYVASSTDGRAVRLDFKGGTKVILHHKIMESVQSNLAIDANGENKEVQVEGYAIKASGATFGFDQLPSQARIVAGGIASKKEQFGIYTGRGNFRGEGNAKDLMEERDFLLKYLDLGARVDVPIVFAKLDEPKAQKTAGILAIAYRTPFNFEIFQRTPNRNYEQTKYLMMHGISIWKREALIGSEELAPLFSEEAVGRNQRLEQISRLVGFYVKNGSKIAGADLAKIHQISALGNRNPQNMGNDFGHRDVSDFPKPHPFDRLLPSEKYEDINGDLDLIRGIIDKLKPESRNELFEMAVDEYLKSYFSSGLGMGPKEFGINLLKEVIKNIIPDQTQIVMVKKFYNMAKDGFYKKV